MKRILLPLLALLCAFAAAQVPEPVVQVYSTLKNLHINTPLAAITIVAPDEYRAAAKIVQEALHAVTGKSPAVEYGNGVFPLQKHVILLGNRNTNKVIGGLYDRGYSFLDLKYPGSGGYVVQSLHNPFGNGYNVLFAGGSDAAGVRKAAEQLAKRIRAARGGSVQYLADIQLGNGYRLPANIADAEIWEASEMYRSSGYFGWNIVSKYMALFYMTGEERYLREFLRLAFPDAAAMKEIDALDGERIENKTDPLAGPYHYSAHMMIVLWDLIEESPLLTDSMRLKITNAFARQLPHRVVEGVYRQQAPAAWLGDRHSDWSAFSLYVLGRYFQKDYPSPIWQHCVQTADRYFSALHNTYWMGGKNDHLFWFTSFYDPVLNYLLFSGHREPQLLNNLRKGLNTQHIISTGMPDDWGIRASALSMLNKAAYILGDGRWLYYRQHLKLDTNVFRLGQSYWPGHELRAIAPAELAGSWNFQHMAPQMAAARQTGFTPEQSFRWGSYRSELGAGGDYVLLKGYNGAGRNPYHTFSILELRLGGQTVLKGYQNQVLTSADGMSAPRVAMDAALVSSSVLGQSVAATVKVPDLPFAGWERSLLLRNNRYALVVDVLQFNKTSNNFEVKTVWEMPGPDWLHSATAVMETRSAVTTQLWRGKVGKGTEKIFFHLLGKNVDCRPLAANAVWLRLPEKAFAVAGVYDVNEAGLAVVGELSLYGRQLKKAGGIFRATAPVAADWDFTAGKLIIETKNEVTVELKLHNKPGAASLKAAAAGGWYGIRLSPGRHEINGVKPAAITWPAPAKETQPPPVLHAPALSAAAFEPVMRATLGDTAVQTITVPGIAGSGPLLATVAGNNIHLLRADGTLFRQLQTPGKIKALHWWPHTKLLVAGCADEQVIAFNENGKEQWRYTSVMDHAVYEAGKQYWFKSAYPGVDGLSSGVFDGGQQRLFVGSACTVEVLDEQGKLVKSIPVFWGNVRQFLHVKAPDGTPGLLVARWQSDRVNMAVISSKTMAVERYGYEKVPEGHTFVDGWMTMNRYDNFLADLGGDGHKKVVSAINGSWNRISVYSETGEPEDNISFGPGVNEPRANIRMMDVADITGDGKPEIIAGLSSGMIDVFNGQTRELLWAKRLPGNPAVVKVVNNAWLCVGMDDGTILAMDAAGGVTRQGRVDGRPIDVQVLASPKGAVAIVTTATGNISGFTIPAL